MRTDQGSPSSHTSKQLEVNGHEVARIFEEFETRDDLLEDVSKKYNISESQTSAGHKIKNVKIRDEILSYWTRLKKAQRPKSLTT